MSNLHLILCFLYITFSSSILAEDGFQFLGSHYRRKNYDNANFDELFEDFSSDSDITSHEYKFIINKGLSSYFLICDRIEKLKRNKSETPLVNDDLKFNPPSNVSKTFTFYSVEGLSQVKADDTELILSENQPYFEVKSEIYLPKITFRGTIDDNGVNQSVDYEMSDIIYSDWQRKKVSDEYDIKLSRSCEKFRANATKLAAKTNAQYGDLDDEIGKDISKYLPKLIEQVKLMARNVTLSADIRYLLAKKEKNVHKLSIVISNAIRTFGNVSVNIPRFSFESSSTVFDLISSVFEVDARSTNVSVTLLPNGDFALTTPVDGTLTYFLTEQNCTESCNTYGDRVKIQAIDATVTFNGRKLEKVFMTLNLVSGNANNADHYLRKPAEGITKSMLIKTSKFLSERLAMRLKYFLK